MKNSTTSLALVLVISALSGCSKPVPPVTGGVYRVEAIRKTVGAWGREVPGYEIRKVLSSDGNDYVYVRPERGRWFQQPPDEGIAKAMDWGRSVRQGREPLKSFAELKPVLLYVANAAEVKAKRVAQAPSPAWGKLLPSHAKR